MLQTTQFEAVRHLLGIFVLTFLGVLFAATVFEKTGNGQVLSSGEQFAPLFPILTRPPTSGFVAHPSNFKAAQCLDTQAAKQLRIYSWPVSGIAAQVSCDTLTSRRHLDLS